MIDPQDFTLMVYNIALIPMIFLSVLFLMLSFISLFTNENKQRKYGEPANLPFVSVQVPTFNDPIAARCIRKCMKFDYPKDRYEIIIADDSTNVKTQQRLKRFEKDNPNFIKYIHRTNREGFKPGALKNAMSITKGEIIVLFDSDWIPGKGFLKEIIKPFSDKRMAIVQTKQGFYNYKTNVITRFAAYTLMAYHTIMMPLNNRINCVFFCGTAGALRRSAFDEVGGWNTSSITEDSELSVKLLRKGYRSVYLDIETPSEVPDTYEGFIKQQMRWCYGNTRVFLDKFYDILFGKGLSLKQRFMITYLTLGNVVAPIVIVMTLFGLGGWFLGEPGLFNWNDLISFAVRFAYTAGFLIMGTVTLYKRKQVKEILHLVYASFTIGLILSMWNSYAFFKALINSKLHWFCTPKSDNQKVIT